jgi:hypothetical protein
VKSFLAEKMDRQDAGGAAPHLQVQTNAPLKDTPP